MDTPIPEAEAFGLLQDKRAAFTQAATPFLIGGDIDAPTGADAANRLLDMTIAAYEGGVAAEADARGFPRAIYSLFGDNLVPLLKDVLGAGLRTADIWSEGTRKVGTPEMGNAVVAALTKPTSKTLTPR